MRSGAVESTLSAAAADDSRAARASKFLTKPAKGTPHTGQRGESRSGSSDAEVSSVSEEWAGGVGMVAHALHREWPQTTETMGMRSAASNRTSHDGQWPGRGMAGGAGVDGERGVGGDGRRVAGSTVRATGRRAWDGDQKLGKRCFSGGVSVAWRCEST